jgi:hypothetical protein
MRCRLIALGLAALVAAGCGAVVRGNPVPASLAPPARVRAAAGSLLLTNTELPPGVSIEQTDFNTFDTWGPLLIDNLGPDPGRCELPRAMTPKPALQHLAASRVMADDQRRGTLAVIAVDTGQADPDETVKEAGAFARHCPAAVVQNYQISLRAVPSPLTGVSRSYAEVLDITGRDYGRSARAYAVTHGALVVVVSADTYGVASAAQLTDDAQTRALDLLQRQVDKINHAA